MFQRDEHSLGLAGGAASVSIRRTLPAPQPQGLRESIEQRFAGLDLTPDLGARIGSPAWFRGAASCLALCAATVSLAPGFGERLAGTAPAPLSGAEWEDARAQTIAPLALGADTGRRTAAGPLVERLAETPERPSLQLTATLGQGDGFARVLQRAGVGDGEAAQVADMVARAVPLPDIAAGTRMAMTLGRRPSRDQARPLDALAFRARFELNLALSRAGGRLVLTRLPIAIDRTPLRVQGRVGASLYRSARAAGVPAEAVATYIRAIAARMSLSGDVQADDRFDMVVQQDRAATGEVRTGELLFAELDQGRRKTQLLRWDQGGRSQWFEASGVGEQRTGLARPVNGHQTSGFGMRFHPILGFSRMHQGVDFGAPYGSPIFAATDGTVVFSGRHGGHGNFVRIDHGNGLGTGYAHMSRILAHPGEHVARGQVIGYVGSTGLSTGPHLHYELYRNGRAVNPLSVQFTTTALLQGEQLRAFRARLAQLLGVHAGAAGEAR